MMITQEIVKSAFKYEDGKLYWQNEFGGGRKNCRAGGIVKTGYRLVRIKNHLMGEHRVIFLWHHGYLPKQIDHINKNPVDNRIENLRAAEPHQNSGNSNYTTSSSGLRGVHWHKKNNTWRAQIKHKNKQISLGCRQNLFDACCLRISAENNILGDFSPRKNSAQKKGNV